MRHWASIKGSPDRQATGAGLAKPPFGAAMRLGWRGQWLRSQQSPKAGNHFARRFVYLPKVQIRQIAWKTKRFPTSRLGATGPRPSYSGAFVARRLELWGDQKSTFVLSVNFCIKMPVLGAEKVSTYFDLKRFSNSLLS
jgi:hypothetical protein